jgi:hypothetical protein
MDLCSLSEEQQELFSLISFLIFCSFTDVDAESLLSLLLQEQCRVAHRELSTRLVQLADSFGLVKFFPISQADTEGIDVLLQQIDNALQFDEEQEVITRDFDFDDCEEVEQFE